MKKLTVLSTVCTLVFGSFLSHGEPTEIPLIAGKNYDVGSVFLWNDATHLYVQYSLDESVANEGWCIIATKVHIGESISDFPMAQKGNPKLGHFDYQTDVGCTSLTEPLAIDLVDLASVESLFVAAYASIQLEECIEESPGEWACLTYQQGAWADGIRFTTKGNWAMYLEYSLAGSDPEPCCELLLSVMSFDPFVMGPVIQSFQFTVCGDEIVEATGPDTESPSDAVFDAESSTVSFTVTLPDASTSLRVYSLIGPDTLLDENGNMVGFWEWGNCME